ncbi:MAG TPA: folate-binding protein YgfZ [Solibacterales bacterium]|nr:folate-binding protein YgfZ [Bryobacterales bacterium]
MSKGYEALRERAAWIDLTGRGKVRVTGEDRRRLLHAMTTNHVQELGPGQGLYAFFLNDKGRILADVNLFALEDALLLDLEPEVTRKIYDHLDRFIIADDAAVEDVTETLFTLSVEGPAAEAAAASIGAPVPAAPWGVSAWGAGWVARAGVTGQPGFFVFAPAEERAAILRALEAAGIPEADAEAANIVRLENARPRYGVEMTEKSLPQETRQMHAIHFSKGCYLGQEIVERIRSRALLHRAMAHVAIEGDAVPAGGTELLAGEQKAGELFSAAYSPALGKVVGLANLRIDFATLPPLTTAGGAAVTAREIST